MANQENSNEPQVIAVAIAPSTSGDKPFAVATVLSDPAAKSETPTIKPATLITYTVIVMATLFGAYLLYQLLPVVLLLLLAVLFATAIEPLVNKLRRGPFSRTQGILVVYTGIVIVLVAVAWLTVPLFVTQIGSFITNIPKTANSIRQFAESSGSPFLKQQLDNVATLIEQFFGSASGATGSTQASQQQLSNVTTTALGAAEGIFGVLSIFVIAFYWLTERTLIKRWFVSLLPSSRANRVRRVWDDIEVKVGGWVRGQLTLMSIIGIASAFGYFGIGVSYWPALALFAGIAEAIPLVGPYIGVVPTLVVALTQNGNDGLPLLLGAGDMGSLLRAGLIAVFAVVLQTIEGNVLIPRIMRNNVGISPLAVMVSILMGAALAGLVGALLAVPIAAIIQVIVSDLRAAAKSEQALEATTAAAEETRRRDDELVVAKQGADGTTVTDVQSGPIKP